MWGFFYQIFLYTGFFTAVGGINRLNPFPARFCKKKFEAQHEDFIRGHISQYYSRSNMFKFRILIGSGVLVLVRLYLFMPFISVYGINIYSLFLKEIDKQPYGESGQPHPLSHRSKKFALIILSLLQLCVNIIINEKHHKY